MLNYKITPTYIPAPSQIPSHIRIGDIEVYHEPDKFLKISAENSRINLKLLNSIVVVLRDIIGIEVYRVYPVYLIRLQDEYYPIIRESKQESTFYFKRFEYYFEDKKVISDSEVVLRFKEFWKKLVIPLGKVFRCITWTGGSNLVEFEDNGLGVISVNMRTGYAKIRYPDNQANVSKCNDALEKLGWKLVTVKGNKYIIDAKGFYYPLQCGAIVLDLFKGKIVSKLSAEAYKLWRMRDVLLGEESQIKILSILKEKGFEDALKAYDKAINQTAGIRKYYNVLKDLYEKYCRGDVVEINGYKVLRLHPKPDDFTLEYYGMAPAAGILVICEDKVYYGDSKVADSKKAMYKLFQILMKRELEKVENLLSHSPEESISRLAELMQAETWRCTLRKTYRPYYGKELEEFKQTVLSLLPPEFKKQILVEML